MFVLVRVSGIRLDSERVPSGEAKASILAAVARATKTLSLRVALRALGLSASRYHGWRRLQQVCDLEDRPGWRGSHS